MNNLFDDLLECVKKRQAVALAVVIKTKGAAPRKPGAKMIVLSDGRTMGTLGGGDLEKKVIAESLEALTQGEPRIASFILDIERGNLDMMCGGEIDVYIDPLLPQAKLIIFGAGHITKALAPLMQMAGFLVTVVDDSPDLLQKEKFPNVDDLKLLDMERFAEDILPEPDTYIVILSRGFSKDEAILRRLIKKDLAYVGMIGSRRKITTMREILEKEGVPREAFTKLHAPIGLDIGGETPEEIAISATAEIIAAKKGKLHLFKAGEG